MKARVLLVDDEQLVLDGYRRNLHRQFDLTTAPGPQAGLIAVEHDEPFAVVVSDLQMPGMDGIAFLERVRDLSPDTARIMLTGQADLDASIGAVNKGHVFRFLTKPCSAEALAAALDAGVEQYRLRRAEKELLEDTLQETVQVMVEVLGLADRSSRDRANRVRASVGVMSAETEFRGDWELLLATTLSQLGTLTLSDDTLAKLADGSPLDSDEQTMFEHHPEAAFNLLSRIPRLETVAAMIRGQLGPVDGSSDPRAAMIAMAAQYDRLLETGSSQKDALAVLRSRHPDPKALALTKALGRLEGPTTSWERRVLDPVDVHSGMVTATDVRATSGALLIRKGERMVPALLERLRGYAAGSGIEGGTVTVLVPTADAAA